jgi:hypothetical protein
MRAGLVILAIIVAAVAIVGCVLVLNNGSGHDDPQPGPEPGPEPKPEPEPIVQEAFPDMYVSTEGGLPITSKEEYIGCEVSVVDEEFPVDDAVGKIRGRGNTTWMYDKKGFNIKFDSKTDLFGFGASKKWCLIPDYGDTSLIRNYLVYNTADAIGCMFTPSCHHVNLYLNDEYQGVYLLTEKVEVGKNSVNIDDSITDTDIGFLVELDIHSLFDPDSDPRFTVGISNYVVKDPDVNDEQVKMIKRIVTSAYNAINSGDWSKVTELIDTDTFVSTYIIEELFKDADVTWSSFFLYRDIGGKLCSGPIWDFDKSTANENFTDVSADTSDYVTLQAAKNSWYAGLLKYDEFREALAKEISRCKDIITSELESTHEYALAHQDEFERNFTKWEYESIHGFLLEFCGRPWSEEVEHIMDWVPLSLNNLIEVYC